MSDFNKALPTILLHEGRYVNDKNDPGGATDYGISLQFLLKTGDLDKDGWQDGDINHDRAINVEDIKLLTQDEATNLYKMYFWDKNSYALIEDQKCATKIFDLCVNMGAVAANKVAQRAVRSALRIQLLEDGLIGQKTITALNASKPDILLAALKSEAAGYYRAIRLKTGGEKDFLKGWLNRAYS